MMEHRELCVEAAGAEAGTSLSEAFGEPSQHGSWLC